MAKQNKFLTDSRITGLLYLGLAITGVTSYAFIRSQIFVEGNASETLNNLVSQETLSRVGIASEIALVLFQVLTALWFYKLFKKVGSFAAVTLAVFGTINAVAILVASAFWLSAQNAAAAGDIANYVYSLFQIHDQIWAVSGLSFGLWLIPMGYLVKKAGMPKNLAGFLIYGGILYVLSAFVVILLPDQSGLADLITTPAAIGEFWIIGYLLFKNPKFQYKKT